MRQVELLSPAGDFEKLKMAIAYGADAVYLAGHQFGMRAGTDNFSIDELEKAVLFAHQSNVRVYVTCNTIPTNSEVEELPGFLSALSKLDIDGIIVADIGVLQLIKQYCPNAEIHISTQAGVMNYQTANAFYELGAKRVVLARELSIDQIKEIRNNTPPDLDIEAFCHGSMCMSFSGRCLLSNYMASRDANRGMCAQPCRWKYYLMEEKRPGEFYSIEENQNGTYIFNSKDLCTIHHIKELIDSGISSLKIEGRTKSAYYVASTTNAYRNAIDAVLNGQAIPENILEEVNKTSHRPYSTGFYFGDAEQFTDDSAYLSTYDVIGIVQDCDEDGMATVLHKNKFQIGEEIELLIPKGNCTSFVLEKMYDEDHEAIEVANRVEMIVKLPLPMVVLPNTYLRRKRSTQ